MIRSTSDGATQRDHAESAARQWETLGRKPVAIPLIENGAEFPGGLEYLWNMFLEILSGQAAGFGPAIITWEGLFAWSHLTATPIEPWECKTLVRLGITRANVFGEVKPRGTQNKV